jgi:tetratricopeptide (TPR) repeat protein
MRHALVPLSLLLILWPGVTRAQFPPTKATNLEVLPKDIPMRALLDTMGGFTRALGVRCTYCHVGREGEPLSTFDFAADTKPEKGKAREMLRMVADINGTYLTRLASRREPPVVVACATCHRGVAEPRPLQQVVLAAYDRGGVDSAEATYRTLRQRYYGRAAYDFGEVALADVGSTLRTRNHPADALRVFILNTELFPTSAFAFRQAGDAQLASGDTTAAIRSYEHALTLNAGDPQARRSLDALRKKP